MTTKERADEFSVRVTECVRFMNHDGKNFPLCGKLLECAVSAALAVRGGKVTEAADCVTKADYILEMAMRSGYMTETQTRDVRAGAQKLMHELNR